jgi:hypothetical protein
MSKRIPAVLTVVLFAATPVGAAPDKPIGSCSGAVQIASNADWSKLNGPGTVFCVSVGSFAPGTVNVTADGTAASPRILRFVGSSSTYEPWQAATRATFSGALVFGGANHWVVDGIRFTRTVVDHIIKLENATHVTFQNILMEGAGGGVGQLNLRPGISNITLQNSVLRDTTQGSSDRHCIKLVGRSTNVRIVDNEIYNCAGDAIQVGNGTSSGESDVNEGVVIQGNDLYITTALWSNCNGVKTITGPCACAENAIDIKGTTRAADPVPESKWAKIRGNRMWGFQKPDSTCGGTPSSHTQTVVFHYSGADNILFEDNIVFDAGGGIGLPDKTQGAVPPDDVSEHITIRNNLVYNIWAKSGATTGGGGIELFGKEAFRVEYYFNSLIKAGQFYLLRSANSGANDFRCNLVIDGKTSSGSDQMTVSHDAYYNSAKLSQDAAPPSIVTTSAAAANMIDQCFTIKRQTAPKTKCLAGAMSTASSPHANLCSGVAVGSVPNIGVDNAILSRSTAGAALPRASAPASWLSRFSASSLAPGAASCRHGFLMSGGRNGARRGRRKLAFCAVTAHRRPSRVSLWGIAFKWKRAHDKELSPWILER